jgi:ParB family chromosome partitioning protein
VQKVVQEGLISMGHARALLGLADRRRQEELCALAVRKGLSVRDVEGRVRELQGRTAEPVKVVTSRRRRRGNGTWSRACAAHLGTKVQVRNGEGYHGQIVIEYHGREDLDRIYGLLAPKKTL